MLVLLKIKLGLNNQIFLKMIHKLLLLIKKIIMNVFKNFSIGEIKFVNYLVIIITYNIQIKKLKINNKKI